MWNLGDPQLRLTDISLRSLKPGPEQYAVLDDVLPNFGVRVGTTGKLSFFVMYRKNGTRKRDTLGQYPMIITLAEARLLARQRLARLVLKEENPEHEATVKFSVAVLDFLQLHCAVRNKKRTADETERLLNRHWLPAFGRKALQDIRTHDVTNVLDELLARPCIRKNAYAAIRTFFNWARQRRLIKHSPCDGLKLGHRSETRTRVLSDEELVAVYRAAGDIGYPFGTIVQLLLLNAQRRNEIANLRRSFIAPEKHEITLPAALVKNNREHTFVYGNMTADILESLPELGDFLFPARGHDDRAFSGWSKAKRSLDLRSGVDFTLHDLRRTWATRTAHLGIPPWVIEAHINHVSGVVSGVSAIYNRYAYLKETKAAVELFEQHLSKLLES